MILDAMAVVHLGEALDNAVIHRVPDPGYDPDRPACPSWAMIKGVMHVWVSVPFLPAPGPREE